MRTTKDELQKKLAVAELELRQLHAQIKLLKAENERLTQYYYAVEAALI